MAEDVLLIGVDAGGYPTLDRLLEAGDLPNIGSLLERGCRGRLQSTVPPWTPTAWTSLTSGTNPGKHGIFDFKTTDQSRLVSAGDVATNRIWDYLSIAGKSSIVVNVPVTHPAGEIDGVLVPGYLGPEVDEAVAYPPDIVDELRAEIGDYRIYKRGANDSADEVCEEFCDLLRMRADATAYLCNTYEWDFTMVQFQRTDTVFHELPEEQYIDRVYRQLDECVGQLLEAVDADTTLLVSDHGMGRLGDWDVRLNSWLRDAGYLEPSVDGYQPGWTTPGRNDGDRSAVGRLLAFGARVGVPVQRVERLLKRLGLADTVQERLPDAVLETLQSAGGEKIDREASAAYCPSGPGLGIYCNTADPDALIEELSSLRDPDGKPVFEWVKRASDVYSGEQTANGPDVLLLPREMQYYVSATLSAGVFEPSRYEYNHDVEGVCIGAGDGIRQTGEVPVDITDVAPTVLALLGVPLDPDFDGEVPQELTTDIEDPGRQHYETRQRSIDDGRYEDVQSRLEDLGYMS